MSNELTVQVYTNEEFGKIRALEINGEPWFVGKDVAEKLGYKNGNRDIITHIDEDDRIMLDKTRYQNGIEFDYRKLGQRGGWIINESGLYSLILSSKLPTAKEFKRWVTSEVLPSIRKTGSYGVPQVDDRTKAIMDIMNAQNDVAKVTALSKFEDMVTKPLLEEIQDKQEFIDDVVGCNEECIMVGEFARLTKPRYGLGQNKLFETLRELNILRYYNKCNVPYQRFLDAGYFEVRETNKNGHIRMVTMVTVKGQQYLKKRLDKWSKDKQEAKQRRLEQEEKYGIKHFFK